MAKSVASQSSSGMSAMGSIGFGPLTLSPLTSLISRISRFDGRRSATAGGCAAAVASGDERSRCLHNRVTFQKVFTAASWE